MDIQHRGILFSSTEHSTNIYSRLSFLCSDPENVNYVFFPWQVLDHRSIEMTHTTRIICSKHFVKL